MLVMLCTRCQQREAATTPEKRARLEERLGTAWPFPDVCTECLVVLLKEDPELRARARAFQKHMNAKVFHDSVEGLRSAVLGVLNLADRLAAKF